MKCSIIVRCFNEEKHIGRLLCGIFQQTIQDVEIIVVDSGSTDATLAIARQYPVKCISIKEDDFSFGYSLNQGCAAATGEFLVIVSAHVYPVHRDWLETLLKPFEKDKIALVYGKQRGNEVTNFSEHQVFAKWFPDVSDWNQAHPFCNNANAAIRRALWERFPYDESLTGLEDLSWARQVMGAGYRIAYEAGAVIVHVHEESLRSLFNRYRREAVALKTLFPAERFHVWDFLRMYGQNVASDCFHALRRGVLGGNFRKIFLFRLMQFWGTYRGFAQHSVVTKHLKQKFYYPNSMVRKRESSHSADSHRAIIDYSDADEGGGQ